MVDSKLSDLGRRQHVDNAAIQDPAKLKMPRLLSKRP
jgi:hypothetical protein